MYGKCPDENAGQMITVQQGVNAWKVWNSSDVGNISDISKLRS